MVVLAGRKGLRAHEAQQEEGSADDVHGGLC